MTQVGATVQSQVATEQSKAQERLKWPMRIRIFIFCAGIPGAVLAVYYDSKSYKKKSADCWITVGLSIAFHLVAGAVLGAFR